MKKYKHKKSGKIYSLVQYPLSVKQQGAWDNQFVLYKAEYENAYGPYFVRKIVDFFNEFEEIND